MLLVLWIFCECSVCSDCSDLCDIFVYLHYSLTKYIVKYQIRIHFSYSLGYRFSIELPVLEGQEGHSQVSIINLAGRNQILRIIDLKMSNFLYLSYFTQNSIWFLLLLIMYYLPKQLCRIERIFIFDLKNRHRYE